MNLKGSAASAEFWLQWRPADREVVRCGSVNVYVGLSSRIKKPVYERKSKRKKKKKKEAEREAEAKGKMPITLNQLKILMSSDPLCFFIYI